MNWNKIIKEVSRLLKAKSTAIDELSMDAAFSDAEQSHVTRLYDAQTFMATRADGERSEYFSFAAGTQLGNWRILEPLAMGGMGEVYRAERADNAFEQVAALKLLQGNSEKRQQRFSLERSSLAKLEHPNISRIIDGGESAEGWPYLVMELVEGKPIIEYCQVKKLSINERLKLFIELCDAVSYAHSRLIVHQDLKSQNVLVTDAGQVRLIDFGISSELSGNTQSTFAFSLASAAPEQLKGEALTVGTDVFSLGALLHVLITNKHAERESDASMSASLDLSKPNRAIIQKCLKLEPLDRYRSVERLKEDVLSVMQNKPINAYTGNVFHRLGLSLKRSPLAYGLSALVFISLFTGSLVSYFYAQKAQEETVETKNALRIADMQYKRADAYLQGQDALNDILFNAFSDDSDGLLEKLLARWQNSHDSAADNPDSAAATSLSMGRLFFLRRDYASANKVLSAWIDAGYGNADLLAAGSYLRAMSLFDSGEKKKAEPLIRASIKWMENQPLYPAVDVYFMAFRLAQYTNDEKDIARAAQWHVKYKADQLLVDMDPNQKINAHAGDFQLHLIRRDYSQALSSLTSITKVIDDNPELNMVSGPLARNHIAKLNLYTIENPQAAFEATQKVIDYDVPKLGETGVLSETYFWRAQALRRLEKFDEAMESLKKSVEFREKHVGEHWVQQVAESLLNAQLIADFGDFNTALEEVAKLKDKNQELGHPRSLLIELSELSLTLQANRLVKPTELALTEELTTKLQSDYQLLWIYKGLVSAGALNPVSGISL